MYVDTLDISRQCVCVCVCVYFSCPHQMSYSSRLWAVLFFVFLAAVCSGLM